MRLCYDLAGLGLLYCAAVMLLGAVLRVNSYLFMLGWSAF